MRLVRLKTLKEIEKVTTKTDYGYRHEFDVLFNTDMEPLAGKVVELSPEGRIRVKVRNKNEVADKWTIAEWMIDEELTIENDPEYFL